MSIKNIFIFIKISKNAVKSAIKRNHWWFCEKENQRETGTFPDGPGKIICMGSLKNMFSKEIARYLKKKRK